jgi:hypothetical protein
MVETTDNQQSGSSITSSLLTGCYAAFIAFIPATFCIVWPIAEFIIRRLVKLDTCTNIDDFLLVWGCFPLTLAISSLLGVLGGKFGNKLSIRGRSFPVLGSFLAGLLAAFICAIALVIFIYHGWVTTDCTLEKIDGLPYP